MNSTSRLIVFLVALTLSTFTLGLKGQTAPTVTTVHSFTGNADGANPYAGLVKGRDGNFYGTTHGGGSSNDGTVFQMTPSGKLTTLHVFTGAGYPSDGAEPERANLIQGADGALYGTTFQGGIGHGTVFRCTTTGKLTTLHNFTGDDGEYPEAGLIQATNGNFYGTTYQGGYDGYGTAFEITSDGTFNSLYQFFEEGPEFLVAGLVQGSDGNLYGATYQDDGSEGAIFRLTLDGTLTTLYTFEGTANGAYPQGALIQGADGNFYGTTTNGANGGSPGYGTVFRMTPTGTLTTLHEFSGGDGKYPLAALIRGSDGNFYGTTEDGGTSDKGTVFRMTPAGVVTTLHSFTGTGTDGAAPYAGLVQGGNSSFYGTTTGGGSKGLGTIFRIDLPPVVTSPATATATVGKAFSYQIKATNGATSYGVGGLFKGITVDQQTGLISGTPEVSGTKTLTLRATNTYGTGTATLTLTIHGPPVITSSDTATAQVGKAFSFQIKATNDPTRYGAQGLREGLTANASTGVISGTPSSAGIITLTLQAANAAGTSAATLKINVLPAEPVITSAKSAEAEIGKAFTYQITATNGPTQFGAKGLQQGLTANSSTGVISGTPRSTGEITLTLQAANAGGTGTATLKITVAAE